MAHCLEKCNFVADFGNKVSRSQKERCLFEVISRRTHSMNQNRIT